MSNSINLAQKQSGKTNNSELLSQIRRFSFLTLFFVGILSIVIFLLSYRFSIGYVRTQEDKLIKKLAAFDQAGSQAFLLNSRLSDISTLLSGRKKLNSLSQEIINVKPETLIFADYEINSTGVKIQASSTNLADIDNFLNSLLNLTKKKTFSSVSINSLGANTTGYTIQLLIN